MARKYLPGFSVSGYRFGTASIVFLTSRTPAKLTDDLMLAGNRVWKCLSVLEALYLCEQQWVDAVVIAPEVEDADAVEARLRHITIRLKTEQTAKDLIWELARLFPDRNARIQ